MTALFALWSLCLHGIMFFNDSNSLPYYCHKILLICKISINYCANLFVPIWGHFCLYWFILFFNSQEMHTAFPTHLQICPSNLTPKLATQAGMTVRSFRGVIIISLKLWGRPFRACTRMRMAFLKIGLPSGSRLQRIFKILPASSVTS